MRLVAITLAYLLDLILGDPYYLPHPVRGMGMLIEYLERKLRNTSVLFLPAPQEPSSRLRRQACPESRPGEMHLAAGVNSHSLRKSMSAEVLAGIILAVAVVGLVYLVSFFGIRFAENIDRWAGFIISTVLIFTTLSTKSLAREARSVYESLKSGNMEGARARLSLIVGRDTQELDQDEIIRATVETVAENSVDGIISPLFYAALGGAPLALAYKAINTLDSVVGHKNERYLYFGFFSAKLDDMANYIPARLSILLIPLASLILRKRTSSALHTMLRDGKKSPSPNAGIPEGGFAGALGIQLGGVNWYQGERVAKPILGIEIKQRDEEDIIQAIHLMWLVSAITFSGVAVILWYLGALF